MLNSHKLPTRFSSETSLEEGELREEQKPVNNYTFDRKNYKKPDVISIGSGSTPSVRDLTKPTAKLDPVIVLSSKSSHVSSITSNDDRAEKFRHQQSASWMGQILVELDRTNQPIDRVSMWRVTKEELNNSTWLPYRSLVSDSAQMPVTPLRVTTSDQDCGSMIKVRKSYSPKTDDEQTETFKRPKTPSTTSEKSDTPPHTRILTPKSVHFPSSTERDTEKFSPSISEEDGLMKQQSFETPQSEDTKQHEFYKYLGIETMTDYEKKLRQQEELALTRRSSRVKYRQMKHTPDGDSSLTDDSPEKSVHNLPPSHEPVALKRKPLLSITYFPKKSAVECEKSPSFEDVSIFSQETQVFDVNQQLTKVEPVCEAKASPGHVKKQPTLVKKVKRSFTVSQFLAGLRSGRNRLLSKYPRRNPSLKPPKKKKVLISKSFASKTVEHRSIPTTMTLNSSGSSSASDVIQVNNLLLNRPPQVAGKSGLEVTRSRNKVVPTATVTPTQLKTVDLTKERTCTMVNPLSSADGTVLRIAMTDNLEWVVVQERAVSFWKFVRFSALLGMAPNMVSLGKIARLTYDTEIQFPNACELCYNDGAPVYVELRGKQHNSIESYRSCPVASVYANVYYFDNKKLNLSVNSIQLDSIFGLALDIRFITLPNSRYFIMSWYQLSAENTNLTGLTKYSLTPDLKSLASIKNFPTVAYKMLTLNLLSDNRIIGIGETCITIWSYNNGDVLSSMMTSNRIGQNLACVEYSMVNEKYLFLINFLHDDDQTENQRTLKVVGWDLMATQNANRVVTTQLIELDTDDMATIDVTVSHKHDLCIVTFHSGQYILISLNNLQVIHQAYVSETKDTLMFNSNNFIVRFAEGNTSLIVKDVMQFLLETLNER